MNSVLVLVNTDDRASRSIEYLQPRRLIGPNRRRFRISTVDHAAESG